MEKVIPIKKDVDIAGLIMLCLYHHSNTKSSTTIRLQNIDTETPVTEKKLMSIMNKAGVKRKDAKRIFEGLKPYISTFRNGDKLLGYKFP